VAGTGEGTALGAGASVAGTGEGTALGTGASVAGTGDGAALGTGDGAGDGTVPEAGGAVPLVQATSMSAAASNARG
jgi:hypothetical protein